MSRHFITGRDDLLLPWAAKRIPNVSSAADFGQAVALGIATGSTADDQLLAVVVYHVFQPDYRSCMISMASAHPRWCDRGTCRAILSVPFRQYGCNRVWTMIPHTAERIIRLNQRLGFKKEGTLREAFGPGIHGVVCGMLRREFERRYERRGKEDPVRARAA